MISTLQASRYRKQLEQIFNKLSLDDLRSIVFILNKLDICGVILSICSDLIRKKL